MVKYSFTRILCGLLSQGTIGCRQVTNVEGTQPFSRLLRRSFSLSCHWTLLTMEIGEWPPFQFVHVQDVSKDPVEFKLNRRMKGRVSCDQCCVQLPRQFFSMGTHT